MVGQPVIKMFIYLMLVTELAIIGAYAGIMMSTSTGPVDPAVDPPAGPVDPVVEPPAGPIDPVVEPPAGPVDPAGEPPAGPTDPVVEPPAGTVVQVVEPPAGPTDPVVEPPAGPADAVVGGTDAPVETPIVAVDAPAAVFDAPAAPVDGPSGGVDPPAGPKHTPARPPDAAGKPKETPVGPPDAVGPPQTPVAAGLSETVKEVIIPPKQRPIARGPPDQAAARGKSTKNGQGASQAGKGKPFLVQDLIDESGISAFDECLKADCKAPSLCYIPHPTNCFKFIMCQPTEAGALLAQIMPCAFGTKWKSGVEPACDRYDLVKCNKDPCRDPRVGVYGHPDGNCRTFWRCVDGQSHPGCCDKYQRFDPATGNCVNDETCDDVCPLMNDATCRGGGLRYADFPDGNCRTHWDCVTGHPHPVCCPDGQGFNVFTASCDPSIACPDTCPQEYQDSCSQPGTSSYDLKDDNCRTYMNCNKQGQADPSCCLPGMEYKAAEKKCVNAESSPTCWQESCPYGFKEECRLEAIPGKAGFYKNLDYYGGQPMPCPIGTVFNATLCQCRRDYEGLLQKKLPPGCNNEIHVLPPSLKNNGSAVAALLMIGEYGQGETGVGNMNAFWDGGDGLNIPYYGSQTFNKFSLEIAFQPSQESGVRQVLLSSCEYINGQPTLEISLDGFTASGGTVNVRANNPDLTSNFLASAPYQMNDNLLLKLLYDGAKMVMSLDYNDPARPAQVAAQPFTGQVAIDRGGLRFGHCRYEDGVVSFIGYVNDIKFSKCVSDDAMAQFA